ncbi:MAG: hypothetical protein V4502_05200, partial [Pseudomonadota bacterium]
MKSRLITALAGSVMVALASSSAIAQRPAPTPEQRIDRLEKQVQQMQRQVFPKGRPADTAGFSDDPAASQSAVVNLDQRLESLERQMADLVRQGEENGNRLRNVESGLAQMKSDQDQRIASLELRMSEAAAATPAPVVETAPPPATATKPKATPPKTIPPKTTAEAQPSSGGPLTAAAASDPGEDAYTEGFRMWEAGNYDQAITALRAFTAAYPKHRRASYAN